MNKPPIWFYIFSAVALLWNLIGAAAVGLDFTLTAEDIKLFPEAQQQMYAMRPIWAPFASVAAVGFGVIGCLGLLLKQSWAKISFILSIVGLVLQDIALFFFMDAATLVGAGVLIIQGLVFLIAVGLFFLSVTAEKNGWIK
ncbi:hypothetical protein [Glaciecola sp. 1036]|uniref:hypothetical protein n=1 Tax=Alteromonadaceae TaxID=72275 RepID=UPI003D023FE5